MSTSDNLKIPKTYRAVSCSGPNKGWGIVDVAIRAPGPHEVFIKVLAAGLCGSDHFVEDGSWPDLKYPLTAGHENVGRIVSVGAEVSNKGDRLKIGALVGVGWSGGYCGTCRLCREGDFAGCESHEYTGFSFHGGHGEYMYAPESSVITIPEEALENASYAELAPLFCAGLTVYGAIRSSVWRPGDLCIVQGVGGLGHLAIQYASKLGLRVYTVSSGSSKAELSKSLGAKGHIDISATTNFVDHIRSLSPKGDGAKLILCTAPYAKHISSIIPAVGRNGTVTLVSAATDANIEVANLLLNMKRATLRGWSCGGGYEADECIRFSIAKGGVQIQERGRQLSCTHTQTDVKAMVKTFSVEEFQDAYHDLIHGSPKFRNVIVFPE